MACSREEHRSSKASSQVHKANADKRKDVLAVVLTCFILSAARSAVFARCQLDQETPATSKQCIESKMSLFRVPSRRPRFDGDFCLAGWRQTARQRSRKENPSSSTAMTSTPSCSAPASQRAPPGSTSPKTNSHQVRFALTTTNSYSTCAAMMGHRPAASQWTPTSDGRAQRST